MRKLRDRVLTWSTRAEALVVILGAFGYSLISTAYYVFGLRPRVAITEYHLRTLLIYEPAVFLVVGGFLHLRGWTLKRLGLIFALWFSKTNRLWPVVVAHAVADFTGLVSFVR